jgi:4-diphosphocytidyl-2-C-methyl-D-erythritol kinase
MASNQTAAITLSAYAQINLYLHVIAKRANGYHELDSLIAFAGTGDRVTIKPCPDIRFLVTGPRAEDIPHSDDNLVLKAARLLATHANISTGAAITLEKNLPATSGIGGGSADAAATLIGLAQHWNLSTTTSELCALGLPLGADIPICVHGQAALVSGIGEIIKPAPTLPTAWLVLANPNVPVSTPSVFAARTGDFSEPAPLAKTPKDTRDFAAALKERRNDLTDGAISVAPVIKETLNALAQCPDALLARLSGSGATCFALFADEQQAQTSANSLGNDHPDWWIEAAPLLTDTAT